MVDDLQSFLSRHGRMDPRRSASRRAPEMNERRNPFDVETRPGYVRPPAPDPMTVIRGSVGVDIDITGLPTAGAISRGVVRHWLFNGYDAKIEQGRAAIRFPVSTTVDYRRRASRGRWIIRAVQQRDDRGFVDLTNPVVLTDARSDVFLLGSTTNRAVDGRPVLLQLEYEAGSALASEPVFWASAERLSVTLLLT